MNRPTVGPQSLRGLPNGFTNQQQIPQNRSVSSRLPPSGKMAGNTSTWAFGGVPMGSAGLNRQENRQMSTFAQAMNSSQQATQLDLSEFPSLSNHPGQQSLTSNQSTWTAGARGLPTGRLQHSNLSAAQQLNAQAQTQQQQDDLFNSSSQLPSSQSGFRFGAQNAVGQSSQPQSNTSTADEFPPLGRNGVGELGQDRASSLLQNVGFGNPPNGLGFGSNNQAQPNRSNGLLNALSSTSRVTSGNRVASPASISGVSNSRSPTDANPNRQGLSGVPENDSGGFTNTQFTSNPMTSREEGITQSNLPSSSRQDSVSQQAESSHPRSQTIDSGIGSSQGNPEVASPGFEDPLAGMSDIDKWGLKGLTYMMQNYPDYAALVTGHNVGDLGFDLDSPEPFSTQIYSLFDSEPPRPDIPLFTNPECYKVHNVATLDSKVSAFNDESLLFMFYSNPGDVQQVMAAGELHNRNWRFHKKLQLWLTKDLEMCPQQISNDTERGYYIFFDTKSWQRERREFILKYSDLEAVPPTGQS